MNYIMYSCYYYSLDGERGFKHTQEIIGIDSSKERLIQRWNSLVQENPKIVEINLKVKMWDNSPIFVEGNDSVVYKSTSGYGNNQRYSLKIETLNCFDSADVGKDNLGYVLTRCRGNIETTKRYITNMTKRCERVAEYNLRSSYGE